MVTQIEISEECDIPGIEDPSRIEFQAKRMINRTTNTHIVSGLKDSYRRFKINEDMELYEKVSVHNSISNAMSKKSGSKEWVENSMSFEAVILSKTNNHYCEHVIKGVDGKVVSITLVSKNVTDPQNELAEYHMNILDYFSD